MYTMIYILIYIYIYIYIYVYICENGVDRFAKEASVQSENYITR